VPSLEDRLQIISTSQIGRSNEQCLRASRNYKPTHFNPDMPPIPSGKRGDRIEYPTDGIKRNFPIRNFDSAPARALAPTVLR
jgi:hypothetical protein